MMKGAVQRAIAAIEGVRRVSKNDEVLTADQCGECEPEDASLPQQDDTTLPQQNDAMLPQDVLSVIRPLERCPHSASSSS